MAMKYSIILGNLGNTCDRFLSSGYKEELDKDTMLQQASQINRVKGVELVGHWDIDESNVGQMKQKLDGYGAIKSSVLYLQKLEAILDSVGMNEVEELIKK
jgi:hypothetical protein